jgi:hypothetical protein
VQSSDNIFSRIGDIAIDGFDFEFGGAGMSINGTDLYMTGLKTAETLGRVSLPTSVSSGVASTVTAPVAVSGSVGPTQDSCITGSLVYGGNLYISRAVDYDANTDQNAWIKVANLSVGAQGTTCTMSASNGAYSRRLAGPMGHIPAAWQDLLGGPAFTTGGRMSIVTNAQMGYGFGVFDPADVVSGGGAVSVSVLLDYDATHPLEPYPPNADYTAYPKNASGGTDLYSVTNAPLGCAFIAPGSRSLLFITCHGYGVADNGCRPGSSVNNSPFRIQVVAYDLNDLIAVKNGTKQPYEPQPYAWWALPGWDTPWGACVGNPSPGAYHGNFCYLPNFSGGQNWLIGLADGTSGFPTLEQIQVWTVASL